MIGLFFKTKKKQKLKNLLLLHLNTQILSFYFSKAFNQLILILLKQTQP